MMTMSDIRPRLATWLRVLADHLYVPPQPTTVGGKMFAFTRTGRNLGHDVLSVESIRGDMYSLGGWANTMLLTT